jgi:hypothetical protein
LRRLLLIVLVLLVIKDAWAANLVSNPGFESGSASWTYYNSGTGTFDFESAAPYAGTYSAKLIHTSLGVNVQLLQTGYTVTQNTWYRCSFWAKSTDDHIVNVALYKNSSPYTNYGLSVFPALTGSWTYYEYDFQTPAGTLDDGRFTLLCGSTQVADPPVDGAVDYYDEFSVDLMPTGSSSPDRNRRIIITE